MTAGVIHGECLALMNALPAGCVDAVIADPPYGTTRCAWDAVIPVAEMWSALSRVCRPGAPVVLTASMPFTAVLAASNLRSFRHSWVWAKNKATGHLNAKRAPLRAHEDILVFCDTSAPFTPQMTTGHRPGNYARRVTHTPVYGKQIPTEYGGATVRYPKSVLDFDVVNNDDPERLHPSQKPVDLFRYLVRTYTSKGDTVLDFACGSGTTGVACAEEGRKFIGFERDETFAALAHKRVTTAYANQWSVLD